jgi:hypothetical protein
LKCAQDIHTVGEHEVLLVLLLLARGIDFQRGGIGFEQVVQGLSGTGQNFLLRAGQRAARSFTAKAQRRLGQLGPSNYEQGLVFVGERYGGGARSLAAV